MSEDEKSKPKVSGSQLVGGVLTAVTSAVLLSKLGSIGTLAGAAVSSVVYTIGGSVYTHYVEAGKKRVQRVAGVAIDRAQQTRNTLVRSSTGAKGRDRDAETKTVVSDASSEAGSTKGWASWRKALRAVPWKRVGALTVGLFVVAMAVIVTFELFAGRSVASFTGGAESDGPRTTISFKHDRGNDGDNKEADDTNFRAPDSDDVDEVPEDENQAPDQNRQNENPGEEPGQPNQQPGEQQGQDGASQDDGADGGQDAGSEGGQGSGGEAGQGAGGGGGQGSGDGGGQGGSGDGDTGE